MEETKQLLRFHLSLYPGMEVEDCIKLLYQGELGPGHLIEDADAFEERLRAELALPGLFTATPEKPVPVGGGLCRVHLSSLENGPSAPVLAALCAMTARRCKGSRAGLLGKLEALREMDAEGALALKGALLYQPGRVAAAIDAFIAAGCPQPRHSARYAALYAPHYRVMEERLALWLPVLAAIDAALGQKCHVLVGIDGMAAAGKSSLAALLAQLYGCGVVHADDFFLQPHQRSAARLAQPGGNVDYERLAPVAQKAAEDRAFTYAAYNCQTGRLDEERKIPAGRLTVLEGAYSLHPEVGAACDVRVFLQLDARAQAQRVEARNGPELARRFKTEWIPMENCYFAEFGVREGCELVLDTTALG